MSRDRINGLGLVWYDVQDGPCPNIVAFLHERIGLPHQLWVEMGIFVSSSWSGIAMGAVR